MKVERHYWIITFSYFYSLFTFPKRFFLTIFLAAMFYSSSAQKRKQPVDYVNPFIGASTNSKLAGNSAGLGKTFPGATTPFGMVQVSPNTITGGDNGSGYSDEHRTIEGFALTQMSGVGWYGDMGNFLVTPTTGRLNTAAGIENKKAGYRCYYDKTSEHASAGFYEVTLSGKPIHCEMTATTHCGFMRFTFPQNLQSRVQIDLARRVGGTSTLQYLKVIDAHTIEGWMKCTPEGGGWGDGGGKADYTVFFYAKINKAIKNFGVWSANIPDQWNRKLEDVETDRYQDSVAHAKVYRNVREFKGRHLGFFNQFSSKGGERILLKTGISFVSIAGAKNNLDTEIPNWNFRSVKIQAKRAWNRELSKIKIRGGSVDQKTTFYTALYHTMIDPRNFQDVDGRYPGGDGRSYKNTNFVKRTIFSGWDVFRSQLPLQTLINPRVVNDLINSQITLATENKSGYFDRWEIFNAYSGCMIGNPSISMIADAYAKGIRHYDFKVAYAEASVTSQKFGNDGGFASAPYSISSTLEYAYSDWCMAQLSKAVGRQKEFEYYMARAKDYHNVFDTVKRWFRPRTRNGDWEAWPATGRLTQDYGTVESNPYQQGWFVPHDIPGLVRLLGGRDSTLADLTRFFEKTPDDFHWNNYYNHANEPVHHVPFLFNRLGAPWLTQKWVRKICENAYQNKVEGLVGNEDVGQMSAWYVLASSGIAQVCPGDLRYEIFTPLFDSIDICVVSMPSRKIKKFSIIAQNNIKGNIYIQKAYLNGRPFYQCHVDYKQIAHSGRLVLILGNAPNKEWGKQ